FRLVIRSFPGPMRRSEVQTQEKRFLRPGVTLDRLHGALAKKVGHVADAIDWHLLLVKWNRRLAAVIEIVGRASEDAKEVVVAALERAEVGQETKVPLTDERGAVAGLLEDRRQGRMARRQADARRRRVIERLLESEWQAHLVAAGDQRGAGRRAIGRIGIGLRVAQSLEREAVDIGRGVVARAVAAHVRIAETVGHDEDDVRLRGLRLANAAEPCERQRARGRRLHEPTTGQCVTMMDRHVSPPTHALIWCDCGSHARSTLAQVRAAGTGYAAASAASAVSVGRDTGSRRKRCSNSAAGNGGEK